MTRRKNIVRSVPYKIHVHIKASKCHCIILLLIIHTACRVFNSLDCKIALYRCRPYYRRPQPEASRKATVPTTHSNSGLPNHSILGGCGHFPLSTEACIRFHQQKPENIPRLCTLALHACKVEKTAHQPRKEVWCSSDLPSKAVCPSGYAPPCKVGESKAILSISPQNCLGLAGWPQRAG